MYRSFMIIIAFISFIFITIMLTGTLACVIAKFGKDDNKDNYPYDIAWVISTLGFALCLTAMIMG